MSDRPSRNEQRRARELAAQQGISYQQALQQLRDKPPTSGPGDVFASTYMGQILTLATREADLLGHGRVITNEHVLIALIWDGSGPVTVLSELGVAERIAARLRELMALPTYRPHPDEMATMMRYVRQYMDTHGHEEMGAADTLAAMTHVQTGVVAQVLDELDVRQQLRASLLPWLAARRPRSPLPSIEP